MSADEIEQKVRAAFEEGRESGKAEAARFQRRANAELGRWSKWKTLGIGFAAGAIVGLIAGVSTADAATLYVLQPIAQMESCDQQDAAAERLINAGVVTRGAFTVCSETAGEGADNAGDDAR